MARRLERIVLATPFLRDGFGIETRVRELNRNLPNSIDSRIICLQQTSSLERDAKSYKAPRLIHSLSSNKWTRFSWPARALLNTYYRRYLWDADVIDAQYYPMTHLPKSGRRKLVITWHSVTFPHLVESFEEAKVLKKEYYSMLRQMKKADLVISVSKYGEREIHAVDDSIPVEVVPNGVDTDAYKFKPFEKRGKTILSVGRFTPHKGHDDVIVTFKRVLDQTQDPELRLIIAGSMHNPAYFEKLKDLAKSLGLMEDKKPRVSFLTNVNNLTMPKIYQLGDIFISGSKWEGFGMPMLEAQACGIPALGYDICSHSEVVADTSWLAPELDVNGLADRCIELLEQRGRYEKASLISREFAEEYSWKKVVKKYVKTLESNLGYAPQ
jgi:glycosyltransferase involved in cell wall biosynthesis